jgi:hypothetical protein
MGQIARTSIKAASANVVAIVSPATYENVSGTPARIAASARFNAFVAFTAWASSLRSTSGVAVVAPPSNTAVKRTAYRRRLPLR